MIDLLQDAIVVREPGPSIASFTNYGDAYSYQQMLGGFGYTVTADTLLGFSVRKWITQPMSAAERQAVNA